MLPSSRSGSGCPRLSNGPCSFWQPQWLFICCICLHPARDEMPMPPTIDRRLLEKFVTKARENKTRVPPELLDRLAAELVNKIDLAESDDQLTIAIEALAEDAAQRALRRGRKEIGEADLAAALKDCHVYPLCEKPN